MKTKEGSPEDGQDLVAFLGQPLCVHSYLPDCYFSVSLSGFSP
jgi:hypothetical protein